MMIDLAALPIIREAGKLVGVDINSRDDPWMSVAQILLAQSKQIEKLNAVAGKPPTFGGN